MPSPQEFNYPLLNATLNGISFVFLLAGLAFILSGRKKAHITCMATALLTSTAFLVSYVTYHYLIGGAVTKFPTEYPTARAWYFAILFSHIPLAALLVPLVLLTVIPALRRRFDKHKKLARITLPIWLYVSLTGVLIYLMLYQWYLPTAESEGTEATHAGVEVSAEIGTGLSFTPKVFKIHAEPSDEVVTARYEVTNNSDKLVNIVELDTSCSCLDVRSDANEIAAGATVVVEADFSLEKLVGTAEKYVIVRTDHPDHLEARLAVQVSVDPIYEIAPLMLDWKVGDELESKEIVFKVVRDKPIHITGLHASREQSFSVAMRAIEPGREYRIVLTPKTTEKELLGFIRVETDCEIEKYASELMYFKVTSGDEDGNAVRQSKSPLPASLIVLRS